MRRSLVISFSIFFCVLFAVGFLPESVGAVSYYNWVTNPSFESNVNLVEDGSFESGAFNSGLVYGNWSTVGGAAFEQTTRFDVANTGVYCLNIENGASNTAWYNLTDNVLGADIEEFTFYGCNWQGAGSFDMQMGIVYSDETTDAFEVACNTYNWIQMDVLVEVNVAKYVKAFWIYGEDALGEWVDDFVLSVYQVDTSDAQDDITLSAGGSLYDWWFFAAINMPRSEMGLSTEVYRGGAQSCKMYDTLDNAAPLQKPIAWLDSDMVHYLDLWVMCNDTSVEIVATVYYTGANQYTTRTIEVSQSSSWQYVNFGGNWIRDGEVITGIRFSVYCDDSEDGFCYFDDVGLWSSVPLGYQRLSYYVSPAPIGNYYNGFHFQLYTGSVHTFYGTLFDENGSASDENGTVTVTHATGVINATLLNGHFQYTIPVRSYSSTTTEYQSLNINTGSVVVVVEIEIGWIVPSTVDDDDDDSDGIIGEGDDFVNFIVFFSVFGLPPMILGMAGAKVGWGLQGLLFGGLFSIGLGVVTGFLPFWMVFMIGVFTVMFIYSIGKRS